LGEQTWALLLLYFNALARSVKKGFGFSVVVKRLHWAVMDSQKRLQAWLKASKFDGILVTKAENIVYLTGFWGSFGVYLQTSKGGWLLTDGRYSEQATSLAKKNGFNFVLFSGSDISAFTKHAKGILAIEDTQTVAELKRHRRWFKGIKLKAVSNTVETLRQVKTKNELQHMRDAQAHVDKVLLPFLEANLGAGLTEQALKFKLDQTLQAEGKYGLSFETIVGFGPGSAQPHYISGPRKLKSGDNILIDCGVVHKHYCSDMTRNFVYGEPKAEYKADYEQLLTAQTKTLAKVKAGVKAASLDKFCRQQVGELAELFTHSLGHGVGLEIHESPTLSSRSKDILQAGQVVTVEPGIYRAEQYGIRIEDNCIVTKFKPEILTQTTKNLLSFDEAGSVQSIIKAA